VVGNTLTGRQLKELRMLFAKEQKTQAKLARKINCSQKLISLYEQRPEVPKDVAQKVIALAKQEGVNSDVIEQILSFSSFESAAYSWPEDLFSLLWKASRKKIGQVTAEAHVRANRDHKSANASITYIYHEMDLAPGERLYLDHLGNPASNSKSGTSIELAPLEAKRAKLNPVKVQEAAIAYEIDQADVYDVIRVKLDVTRAFILDEWDTFGFPIYGDFVVQKVLIRLIFEGLRPFPDPPIPKAYLLRRTANRPASLSSDLVDRTYVVREGGEKTESKPSLTYSFGPLLRPRMGWGYGLTWDKLEKIERTSKMSKK
jgi:hypothetical protein